MKLLKNAWALMSLITFLLPFALYGLALLVPPLYAAIVGVVTVPLWILATLAYFTLAFGAQLAAIHWQDSHPGFKVTSVSNVRLFQASARERYVSFLLAGYNRSRSSIGFTGFSIEGGAWEHRYAELEKHAEPDGLLHESFDKIPVPAGVKAIRLKIHLTNGKTLRQLIPLPSSPA